MVGCTKSTKNINKYAKCYGSSFCSSQTHDWYYSCSCSLNESPWLSFHTVPHHLGLGDDGGGSGDSGDGSVDGSSDEAGGEGSSGVGSDDGGGVDDVVGGVGGGLGGSGDSDGDGGVDGLHVDGRDGVDSSDRGSVDGSNGGSSDSGDSRGSGDSGDGSSGSDSGHGSSGSDSRGSSVGKTVSGKADTSVAGTEETVAGDQLSISISSRGSHGGAEDGGKDNKGVHLDESC